MVWVYNGLGKPEKSRNIPERLFAFTMNNIHHVFMTFLHLNWKEKLIRTSKHSTIDYRYDLIFAFWIFIEERWSSHFNSDHTFFGIDENQNLKLKEKTDTDSIDFLINVPKYATQNLHHAVQMTMSTSQNDIFDYSEFNIAKAKALRDLPWQTSWYTLGKKMFIFVLQNRTDEQVQAFVERYKNSLSDDDSMDETEDQIEPTKFKYNKKVGPKSPLILTVEDENQNPIGNTKVVFIFVHNPNLTVK
jgi:hypothetical protein